VPFDLSLLVVLALALAPAVIAWWTGRSVLARVDDPVLPELLWERRRRLGGFTLAGGLALSILFADDALWALPLLWIALLVSSYPLRRALFGERWSALAFLRYAIFSSIGTVGLWLLAAFAPALVISFALGVAPNNPDLAVRVAIGSGAAFAAVILVWQQQYVRVFLALHRAVPIRAVARPELMARLDAILDRSAETLARRPEVYQYGASGAYVMNAFALPSLSHPAVALGTTLLATLTDDEIVAVFAHEVAHHEKFGARLRRARWAGLLLAVLTVALPAVLVRAVPAGAMFVGWCVPVLVAITLGRRMTRRRDDETASDVRAVVLTGDPAALVSALTKLHVYSRVPRRWPHAVEQAATHPSLARRIQAIRERVVGDERVEPQVAAPITAVWSTNAGLVVALDRDRAYWFEGVPAETALTLDTLREAASSYRAVAYGDLTELNVGIAKGRRSIDATDRGGRYWSVPVAPNDVAAIQAALDRVDVRLGRRRPALAPAGANTVRWLALALLVALAMGGELGIAFIPILFVLVRPTQSAAVAAMAAITIARLLVASRVIVWADSLRQLALLGALGVAVALIVHTVRRVRTDASRGAGRRLTREAWWLVAVLAGFGALMGAAVWPVIAERPAAAIGHPLAISIATVVFGIGAALLTVGQRWWRAGGFLTSLVALGGGVLLSGDGWLVHRLPALQWSAARTRLVGTVRIPGGALSLAASPNGSAYAVTQYRSPQRDEDASARYLIGRIAGVPPRSSNAMKVVFLDEETLLALEARGTDSLELRAERVTADAAGNITVLWRQRFAMMEQPQLIFDRTRGSWIVVGHGDGDWNLVLVTDTLGGSHPRIHRNTSAATRQVGEMMAQPLVAFTDGSAIWSTLAHVRDARSPGSSLMPLLLAMTGSPRWELRGTSGAAERFLAELEGFPSCAQEIDGRGTLCIEHSPNVSRVWRATSPTTVSRVADLPPSLDIVHAEASDRVAAAERFGSRVVVLDVNARKALRLTLPGDRARRAATRWTADVVARGSSLLVLTVGRDGATISRYELQ
jgi:Zn-dependent protease with chaperone function